MTALATPTAAAAVRQIVRVQDDSQFSMMLDTGKFEHMQRVATLFASSTMIPEHYRGNLGNCFIAMQMAVRLGMDPFMFMQKSYIVHGKPGLEAQLCIALMNSSGIFSDAIDYEKQGDDPDDAFDPSYRVRAWAIRESTGKRVNGPWIDWKLVTAEGWKDKPGSKWKTMPEQMFMYRAAAFFGRLHCPERLMGMLTSEELNDMENQPIPAPGGNKRAAQMMAMASAETVDTTATPIETKPKVETAAPTNGAPVAGEIKPTKTSRPGLKKEESKPAVDSTPTNTDVDEDTMLSMADAFIEEMAPENRRPFLEQNAEFNPGIVSKAADVAGVKDWKDKNLSLADVTAIAKNVKLALLQKAKK